MPEPAPRGAPAPLGGVPARVLRVGTWNLSHWTAEKVTTIAQDIPVDVLAVQETHLAKVPLVTAHTTADKADLLLHHGHPVQEARGSVHGKSCGVGFVWRKGIAALPAMPACPAWRRLHAMRRLHGVRLAPRPHLPHGLLLLSVYAPLPVQAERRPFDLEFATMVHALDMQIPTLLLGDFNGTLNPADDYASTSGSRRLPCALLAELLGPGRPWVDVLQALSPAPLPFTYYQPGSGGTMMASRIDLVLANPAALRLVRAASVLEGLADSGHRPVLITLDLDTGLINWQPPRPRPPLLFYEPSSSLATSVEWTGLVEQWLLSDAARGLQPHPAESLDSLAGALRAGLEHLVATAGGWSSRPKRRRLAYDSNEIRQLRRQLDALHRLEALCCRALLDPIVLGPWPRHWTKLLDELQLKGVPLPRDVSVTTLAAAAREAIDARRPLLQDCLRRHRAERCKRFKAALPRLWREDLGVIQRWLMAPGVPWGSRPVLNADGLQCVTVAAIDETVRAFWVERVLRQHAAVDDDERWRLFMASPFGSYIPTATWTSSSWTAARVTAALRSMREGAAPGLTGIPIAVWRALPSPWPEAVARLLNLVEAERRWPSVWLDAYVAMIPKAAGGPRPQDQRPITVLEVLYRLWAKGVVLEWGPTLQNALLSDTAFGFRSGRGTLHAAQVVQDVLRLQRQQRAELWLASFDLAKCFDSLPWWAVFRILRAAGMSVNVVDTFAAFYRDVRRRFRYGAVLGEPWRAANGLAQGCPASPDLLNILFETFHRWAAAQRLGVDAGGFTIASVSFADDLVLLAPSQAAVEQLVAAYLQWCGLLGVQVTKVQIWSSQGPGRAVSVGNSTVLTTPSFRFVGIELGLPAREGDEAHFGPRLEKALFAAQRLRSLPLPAALNAVLWRTTVLPKGLYGCELRNITHTALAPMVAAAKAAVCTKAPLELNTWNATEVALGWPLGDSAPLHPMAYTRLRQLRWLQLLANSAGIAGIVHRAVACPTTDWREPSVALRSALAAVGWSIRRNLACRRSTPWPRLAPEPKLLGTVFLSPADTEEPDPQVVYTDGSVSLSGGGAAVWRPSDAESLLLHVPKPRSSTHCELLALELALGLQPSHVLTDSLCSLQLLQGWTSFSENRRLCCPDRVEVRRVLESAAACVFRVTFEKVRAHDDFGVQRGLPKAMGNDAVDALAKRAAAGETSPSVRALEDSPMLGPAGDPVVMLDTDGTVVLNVARSFPAAWWRGCRRQWASKGPRPRLDIFFPVDLTFDWTASVAIFRRPVVQRGGFVHRVAPRVLKWIARVRCGCLATRERLARHGIGGVLSPACLCCGDPVEDDAHVLVGCAATGAAPVAPAFSAVWLAANEASKVPARPPPQAWLAAHCLPLLAALIPTTLLWHHPLPEADAMRFKVALHVALAERTAEVMRRRGELMNTAPVLPAVDPSPAAGALSADPTGASSSTFALRRNPALPSRLRLSVPELRNLEQQQQQQQRPSPATSVAPARAPPCGSPRRRWLQLRLIDLLREHTVICPASNGCKPHVFLDLFEELTGEQYTTTPGSSAASRLTGFSKALANLVSSADLDPALQRHQVGGGRWLYNRTPKSHRDADRWQRRAEREAAALPVLRPALTMEDTDAGLAAWLRLHPHLRAATAEQGLPSKALLLLWEVDHGVPFPSTAGGSESALVLGFTKRLRRRVLLDTELSQYMVPRDVVGALGPGLRDSHNLRWPVQIVPPPDAEPQPWFELFQRRWKDYLASMRISAPAADADHRRTRTVDELAPAKRRRTAPPARQPAGPPASARTSTPARPRSPGAEADGPHRKKQATLASWRQPTPIAPPRHGRAVQGPPT